MFIFYIAKSIVLKYHIKLACLTYYAMYALQIWYGFHTWFFNFLFIQNPGFVEIYDILTGMFDKTFYL